MTAEIITIGDEILIGQIVDTNSAWIAQQLNVIGIKVSRIVSASDTDNAIRDAVLDSISRADVVITTGGLGPTSDDKTKQVLCEVFGGVMVVHQQSLDNIAERFRSRGMSLTLSNRNQANVPSSCEVLLNTSGTAPGMLFRKGEKVLIALPGVPFEMKHIMENSALGILSALAMSDEHIIHEKITLFGIAESFLSDRLQGFEADLPPNISLAYLPSPSGIRLRLSGVDRNKPQLQSAMQQLIARLKDEVKDYIIGSGDTSLPLEIGNLLKLHRCTVSTAESCTGGSVAEIITSISGSSAYFLGGVVAYSNSLKHSLLGVDSAIIEAHGAVSEQVAGLMAQGARRITGSSYSIATTGIAGPNGGTPTKPVGLVYLAVSSDKQTIIEKQVFGNSRSVNIERASYTVLNMLRKLILKEN